MDCIEPIVYEMVMQDLRRGRDLVLMLQNLTNQPSPDDGGLVDAGRLVEEVLVALNAPITMLSRAAAVNISVHDTEVTINPPISSPVTPDGSRDRNVSCSRKRDKDGICEQIGGRRKRYRSFDRKWTSIPFEDDGFIWKKYGQKKIHGAKHHRMYYKCSQSKDQGCQATKQVQGANDDPSMFAITRVGEHTCQKVIYASDFTLDDSISKNYFKITFGSSCRPSRSSTDSSSLGFLWPKREQTQEDLPLIEKTAGLAIQDSTSSCSNSTITRYNGELKELPAAYIRNSTEQPAVLPPDSQALISCRTPSTNLIDDFMDIIDELFFQEQVCS